MAKIKRTVFYYLTSVVVAN